MAYEQFKNNAATVLTGSVNNSSDPVAITVAVATAFPSAGNFRILIDSEILLVTAVSGLTFTCTRAQEGTTIAAHSNGAAVTHCLTVGSIRRLLADYNLQGTFASRPAAGIEGREYIATDTPFWYYDNGTSWDKFFGTYPIITPDNTGFSWVNQGSAVLTTTKDMLNITVDATSSFRYKTKPTVPYTIDAAFMMNWNSLHLLDCYLGFRESGSGKLHTTGIRINGTSIKLTSWKWTDSTHFLTNYGTADYLYLGQGLFFFRIVDDNTDRKVYVSNDGVNWALFTTVGRTDFLTADQVVWGAGSDGAGENNVSLVHWNAH